MSAVHAHVHVHVHVHVESIHPSIHLCLASRAQVFNRDGHFAAGFELCDASNTVAAVPSDGTLVAWGLNILEGILPTEVLVETVA